MVERADEKTVDHARQVSNRQRERAMTVASGESLVVVSVRFFASLREAVARDAVELALEDASIAGVRAQLATLLTATQLAAVTAPGVQVALNQMIVQDQVDLKTGDEVAFLPPVTGG